MECIFKLFKIDYEEKDKLIVKLYGRTHEGKKICLRDTKSYDYILIDISHEKELDHILESLKKIDENIRHEIFDAEIHDNPAKLLKIFTSKLSKARELSDHCITVLKLPCYEHDLTYEQKYLLEKQIKFYGNYIAEYEGIVDDTNVDINGTLIQLQEQSDSSINILPKILYFDIETYDDGHGIDYERNPILIISLSFKDIHKTLVAKHIQHDDTTEVFSSESEMLERFVDLIKEYKPDAISGYNILNFDIPYILHRLKKYQLPINLGADFSEIKELRSKAKYEIEGILLFDLYMLIRYIMRFAVDAKSLSLDSVSEQLLGNKKIVVNIRELADHWEKENSDDTIQKFVEYCKKDVALCVQLFDYFTFDITEFQKMLNIDLQQLTLLAFSQIVEQYLIEYAHKYNQIIPPRPLYEAIKERSNKRIKGAFVFDPKPGFYENIAVFDFTSLYPTIIESHNITKGTITLKKSPDAIKVPGFDFYIRQEKKGKAYIPTIIENIVKRRIAIKNKIKELKDNKEIKVQKSRLQTLKIIANSLYGYLAFSMARWYSLEAAESVTAFGRYHIKNVIKTFEEEGFEVIYSDTDSIFVLIKDNDEKKADKIADTINSSLPGLMTLEKEDIFEKGIFVSQRGSIKGAKKKYALKDRKGHFKIAGMAMVRGDWSLIARDLQEKTIKLFLDGNSVDEVLEYIKKEISEIEKYPKESFIISTKLKKPVDEYESKGPHVIVASALLQKGIPVRVGSFVKYIITKGAKGRIGERAKIPVDVDQEDIDYEYYINNQIIPVLEGIFDVFGKDVGEIISNKNKDLNSFFH